MIPTKLQQQKVQKLGNDLEQIVTDYLIKQQPDPELIVGTIAGLSNVMVCAAFAVWGPDFGLECITKAVNAAAKRWKESEHEGGGEDTKDRPKP